MIFNICFLIVLIMINGVFSATELSFLSLDKFKLREQVKKGNKRAKKIKTMIDDSSKFLSTIQIGITLAGFLASAFAADYFADYFTNLIGNTVIPTGVLSSILVFIITIVLSYFTLVFGELVPKKIAMNYPDKISYDMVNIISILMKIFYPFIKVLTVSTNLICKIIKLEDKKDVLTEDDIKKMIITGTYEGVVEEEEKNYMFNIFEFNDKELKDIMTPREKCIIISKNENIKEIIKIIKEKKYTRYPVYNEKTNKVEGLLNVKDLILYHKDNKTLNISDILYNTLYFDITDKIDDVFRLMQKERISMSIVLKDDEFAGIVTLEDAMEEIVGNIYDEYDRKH